jgi:LPS O-antigen subunit length determinant protein (WzzB/FepE family)
MDKENKNNTTNDEIDLLELFQVIWKRRYVIAVFVFVVSLVTFVVTLMMDNIYASTAILKPSQQASQQSSLNGLGALVGFAGINLDSGGSVYADINVLLTDKRFLAEFVKKHELAPKLVEKQEIMNTEKFEKNKILNYSELIQRNTSVTEDKTTGYITISFKNKNPQLSKDVVELLLAEISDRLRTQQMDNIDKRIENYKLEMDSVADFTLKTKLSELVANLIQNKVIANADVYYGFNIIAEPYVAEPMDKVGPKRRIIVIIAVVMSFFLASFCTVVYDTLVRIYIKK